MDAGNAIMDPSIPNTHQDQLHSNRLSVARMRQPPTLTTPLFAVREAKGAGYGVFATQAIPAQTELLTSPSPSAYVVYRTFRKEVCAWCFKYERGRHWKLKLASPIKMDGERATAASGAASGVSGTGSAPPAVSNGGGMVFCGDDCRNAWYADYGDIALDAYNALEGFVQRQARNQGWNSSQRDPADTQGDDQFAATPSEEEVDKVWAIIERQAALIRRHRLRDVSQPEAKGVVKIEKKAVQEALTLPVVDTDILFFFLSGVLCRFMSASSPSPSAWDSLVMLNPSNPYPSLNTLYLVVNAYLQLLVTLPPPLLSESVCNRDTIESLLSRDTGNSFGIWSTSDSEEDPEMLGYGIWTMASFFNHSCSPNLLKERQGRKWVFNAAPLGGEPAIKPGTELCITYIRGEEDTLLVEDRRKKLHDGWGFICQCSKCSSECKV